MERKGMQQPTPTRLIYWVLSWLLALFRSFFFGKKGGRREMRRDGNSLPFAIKIFIAFLPFRHWPIFGFCCFVSSACCVCFGKTRRLDDKLRAARPPPHSSFDMQRVFVIKWIPELCLRIIFHVYDPIWSVWIIQPFGMISSCWWCTSICWIVSPCLGVEQTEMDDKRHSRNPFDKWKVGERKGERFSDREGIGQ